MLRILIIAFVVCGCCSILSTAELFPATRPVDKEACEKVAEEGRVFANGTKTRPQSCDVTCYYDDGSTRMSFVEDGTPCDDIGVAPIGRCRGEKCQMGIQG